MLALGWRDSLVALVIVTAIAAIALSMTALPSLFHFAHGPALHQIMIPRHDPAAYHPPSNAFDFFQDETEKGDGTQASTDNPHPRPRSTDWN
jgi:hypothetical protein